jgi:hypothetical protein
MVPSVMGNSYCLPVRLSVIVSVSAIVFVVAVAGIGRCRGWTFDAIRAVGPLRLIEYLAPLAAERPPTRLNRACTA